MRSRSQVEDEVIGVDALKTAHELCLLKRLERGESGDLTVARDKAHVFIIGRYDDVFEFAFVGEPRSETCRRIHVLTDREMQIRCA